MDTKKGKHYLTEKDLQDHSIWAANEIDDLLYPVTSINESPYDIYDLRIRAKFTTPHGLEFLGYTIGFGDIFSIAITIKDKVFYFNRNLPELYEEKLLEISTIIKKKLTISNFSPLKYITDIDVMDIENFEDEFDLLKPRTNEERLWQYNVEK